MGDRANFGFRDSKENVLFLYGHWAGHDMLAKLANAVSEQSHDGKMNHTQHVYAYLD